MTESNSAQAIYEDAKKQVKALQGVINNGPDQCLLDDIEKCWQALGNALILVTNAKKACAVELKESNALNSAKERRMNDQLNEIDQQLNAHKSVVVSALAAFIPIHNVSIALSRAAGGKLDKESGGIIKHWADPNQSGQSSMQTLASKYLTQIRSNSSDAATVKEAVKVARGESIDLTKLSHKSRFTKRLIKAIKKGDPEAVKLLTDDNIERLCKTRSNSQLAQECLKAWAMGKIQAGKQVAGMTVTQKDLKDYSGTAVRALERTLPDVMENINNHGVKAALLSTHKQVPQGGASSLRGRGGEHDHRRVEDRQFQVKQDHSNKH